MGGYAFAAPASVAEALDLLGKHGEEATLLAGGQSLMIVLRQRLVTPSVVVGLKGVAELREVTPSDDGGLRIGAMVSYREAAHHRLVKERAPVLGQACGAIGSVHIRNLGTVGGAVCHADPAGDVPTVLLMSGATVRLKKADGREVSHSIDDFFTGMFETRREPDELLVAIDLPPAPAGATYGYEHFSVREGEYPLCVVACQLEWDGDRCSSARLAVGGGDRHPIRLGEVEQLLTGTRRDATDATEMAAIERAALGSLRPPPDVRGSTEWKAKVIASVVQRALTTALEGGTPHV